MSLATAPSPKLLTAEEFFDLPDDGTDRWLVDGEVRPEDRSMTRRNRDHTRVEAKVAYHLGEWLLRQPEPRGIVHCGEIGFRLRRDPDVLVGADAAYVPAEVVAAADPELPFYDGAPALAVEIISPSDKHRDVVAKVALYLEAGIVVWVIYPDFEIIHVHRPDRIAELYNASQVIDATAYLPGLWVAVAAIFAT